MPYVSPQRWRRITRSRLCSEHNAVCGPERFVKRPPGTDRPLFITFGNFLGAANYFGQFRQDGLQEHLPVLYSSLQALGLNIANLDYIYILYPPLYAEMALSWIFHKILRHELQQCRHRPLLTPDPGDPFDRDSIFGLFNQLELLLKGPNRTMQLQPPQIYQNLGMIVRTIEIIGEFLGQFGCSERLLDDFIKEAEFLVPMVCETDPLANPWIGPWMYSLACSVFVASGLSTTTLLNFLRTVGWDERRQLRIVAQAKFYSGDPLGMIIAVLTP
jgi:hypothetical protein